MLYCQGHAQSFSNFFNGGGADKFTSKGLHAEIV